MPTKNTAFSKKAFQNLASAAPLPRLVCSTLRHFLACIIVFFVLEVIANLKKLQEKYKQHSYSFYVDTPINISLHLLHHLCLQMCSLFPSSYPFLSTSPQTHTHKLLLLLGLVFFFFWPYRTACGIFSSATRDRTHVPLHWKCGVLTTGPPGKSLGLFFESKM